MYKIYLEKTGATWEYKKMMLVGINFTLKCAKCYKKYLYKDIYAC